MRVLTWAVRIALFVVLLAFAAKNTDPVTLKFYFEIAWTAPLVAVLLAFFVAGAFFGVVAMLGAFLAQRKELVRLQRAEAERQGPALGSTAGAVPLRQPPAAEG